MKELEGWERSDLTVGEETRAFYRKGDGRGVIIIHEFPGIEPSLLRLAEEVVSAGFTVVLPHLFGDPGAGFSGRNIVGNIRQFCVRREFSVFARGKTSPIAGWLRALARDLHESVGGPGVGVIGMCFTGGFGLAMMADAPVIAPVIAEPSLPAAVGFPRAAARRGADLGLSPADADVVAESGCTVMGLRFRTDAATGTRFESLRRLLGDRFLSLEFEGRGHSVLTADRQEFAVEEVLAFLHRTLDEEVVRSEPERDQALESRLEAALGPGFAARVTRDPDRVTLFVERGLTRKGLERAAAIAREVTSTDPEVVRVTPRGALGSDGVGG